MTCSSRVAAAALAAGLAACSTVPPHDGAPRPLSVGPATGYRAISTDVVIAGDGFRVEPYQTASGETRVDSAFRAWLGPVELADVRWAGERELRARVPAGLAPGVHRLEVRDPRGAVGALDAAFTVVGEAPPALLVRATLAPAVASVGQPVMLRVEVTNLGDLPALAVRPSVAVEGAALAGPQDPGARDVAAGATWTLELPCTAVAAGASTVRVDAAALDPLTGATLRPLAPAADAVVVQPVPSLSSRAGAAPALASAGQLISIEATFEDAPGAAAVRDLQPSVSGILPPGAVQLLSAPGPCAVASGGSCTATFLFRASTPGPVEVRIDAVGVDANSGDPARAPEASASLVVQRAPALVGRLSIAPLRATTEQPVSVTLEVENQGEVAVEGFAPRITAPLGAVLCGGPPLPQDVPPGAVSAFGWSFVVPLPGSVAFDGQGEGWDANGAGTAVLAPVVSESLVVEWPAALVASALAAPSRASAGQDVAVTLDVTNVGGAAARVSPYLEGSFTGTAGFTADPQAAATIAGGETVQFAWSAATAGAGTIAFLPRVAGLDASDGTVVAASDLAATVTVVRPAGLEAAIVAPPAVGENETFLVAVDVTNGGEAAALGVVPTLEPAGIASLVSGPTPAPPATIDGGATRRFEWTYAAGSAPAILALFASAQGQDENAGTPLSATAAPRSVDVQRAATLSAAILSAPDRVNLGRPFEVWVRVANSGDAAARDVTTEIACAACSAGDPAPVVTVAARSSVDLARSFTPDGLGTITVAASAAGVDATDGLVRWSGTVERSISVEQHAALTLAHVGPSAVSAAGFGIEIEAANPRALPGFAQAAASGVVPGPLLVVIEPGSLGTADVSCAPVPSSPARLAAGERARFAWTCTASAAGALELSAGVSGLDANDGDPLVATTTFTLAVGEVGMVAADPFGDGTSFSYVFGYDGHVFLGPSGDGRGVVRCAPDGTGCASFSFAFWRDTTGGSVSENTVCPYLETLGAHPQCDDSNPASTACSCGPDYESGRGLLGSFRLGAAEDEWLVAMGRAKKAGDLNYAYLTRDTASPLRFSYADLKVAMPPSASIESATSMAVLNGRLYVGLQVDGARRPRMVVLTRTPEPPGLDASPSEAFATTFQGTAMAESGGGPSPISQVDAMLGFAGRLFVANRKAVLVSGNGFPSFPNDSDGASGQFQECTPLAPAAWEATSIARYAGKIDVTPADRGVTALAEWQGRLYLARNTASGVPELWAFTPRRDAGTGELSGCAADRSDWRLVATNFRDAGNTHLTALFASRSHLYVGFDGAGGLQLWRTASPDPADETSFTGANGCGAFTVDGGGAPCAPVGGAGFGDPANTRFLDARAMTFGTGDQVWAAVGSGTSALRVYRISD